MKNLNLFLLLTLFSCSRSDTLLCTEVFITYTLEIKGSSLDDYYSLRLSNGDTLRLSDYDKMDKYYPILNDSSIPQTKGIEERIDFVAIRGDQTRKIPYTFSSDGCHIIKINGLEVIDF